MRARYMVVRQSGTLAFRRHGVDVRGHDVAHQRAAVQDHAAGDVPLRDHAHQLPAFDHRQKCNVFFLHLAQRGDGRRAGRDH